MNVFSRWWYGLRVFIKPDVPHKNSFNVIRLVAALMVVYSHSYAITGGTEPHIGSAKLGTVGVWIFFILSGYLVSASWHQYPRFNVFIAKRALRIFPGLLAMLVFVVLAGVFFTNLDPLTYLTHQETISYFNNLFLYTPQYTLPGVFENNAYPAAVNGSIWTLSYEFTMYLAIAVIGVSRLYKKISIKAMWIALLLLCSIFYATRPAIPSFNILLLNISVLLPFALMFFTGVLVQERLNTYKTSGIYGILAIIMFCVASYFVPNLTPIFGATFLAYAVFAFGKLPHGAWLQAYGDFSYGIYIYAFPVQQALEHISLTPSARKLFLVSTLITSILAILSWFFIEKPALNLKHKLKLDRYPVTQSDEAW